MTLISSQVPNLIGGISQQPPSFRRPNQCSESLNNYNDAVTGNRKRPGSLFVKSIDTASNAYYGTIDRDNNERYIFAVSSGEIKIWDIDGTPQVVNITGDLSYLTGSTSYRHISIADTTFIVNPKVTVNMNDGLSSAGPASGIIFIRAVDYSTTYTVTLNGVTATYVTPASGTIDAVAVAASIGSQLLPVPSIGIHTSGPSVFFSVPPGFTLSGSTSRGEDYMTLMSGQAENFGDLPVFGLNGTKIKVNQNPTTRADDYYVQLDAPANGIGVWRETVKGGLKFAINPATMPHVIVREADGTFTYKPFVWADKLVGDEESNANPSFIGQKINNILFERNRLGFLSDTNIILSESDGLNNFFRSTVATIVDSDPIDLAVSGQQVNILKTSVGVKDGVLLFSEQGQFLLNVGQADILSPETASISSISTYQSNTDVEPKRVGDSILFITRRDKRSGAREYFYESGRDFTQSAGITNHVPDLLPNDLTHISGSATENIVFFQGKDKQSLYVYQFLYSGAEKVVSAWTKWQFNTAIIKFADVIGDYLFVILSRDGEVTIEKVPVSSSYKEPELVVPLCLDSYSRSVSVIYDPVLDQSAITVGLDYDLEDLIVVSLGELPSQNIRKGDVVIPTGPLVPSLTIEGLSDLTLTGDWRGLSVVTGIPYNFYVEFSQPHVPLGEGDVEIEGRLQVRNYTVQLQNTGQVKFRVTYGASASGAASSFMSEITNMNAILNMNTLETIGGVQSVGEVYPLERAFPAEDLPNRLYPVDYSFRVPIMSVNTGYTLRAESDGWQPVTLTKAQWEAVYHKRSQTYR